MKLFQKAAALCSLILVVALTGCGQSAPGTPPDVRLNGTSVIVGETTPSDLSEQGFELNTLGSMISRLPGRSWFSSVYLKKDNVSYTNLVLVNESLEEKPLSKCVIEELRFYDLEDKTDLDITINGVNPIGMTQEELKEALPELELDDADSKYLFHYLNDGDYSVRFDYSDGVLTDISVTHSFPKSYEER